jgi:hypothetical protein
VGVKLTARDGAEDVVAFRTDREAKAVACGGVESAGRVFARGKDSKGAVSRCFTYPQE